MKRLYFFAIILACFSCSKKTVAPICGCDGPVIKTEMNVTGTLSFDATSGQYGVYADSGEAFLICNPTAFSSSLDKSASYNVTFNGSAKSLCPGNIGTVALSLSNITVTSVIQFSKK